MIPSWIAPELIVIIALLQWIGCIALILFFTYILDLKIVFVRKHQSKYDKEKKVFKWLELCQRTEKLNPLFILKNIMNGVAFFIVLYAGYWVAGFCAEIMFFPIKALLKYIF